MSRRGATQSVRLCACLVFVTSAVLLGSVAAQAAAANFIHIATADNITQNYTNIDNPATNSNPSARLLVTMNLSPNGVPAVVDDHPIGVWYNDSLQKWSIFNQDMAQMPVGAAFNVRSGGVKSDTPIQTATTDNIDRHSTVILNEISNGNTEAILFSTANWNPDGGKAGIFDNHSTGVLYTGKQWAIYNECGLSGPSDPVNSMPVGAAFNTELHSSVGNNIFVHVAWEYNIPRMPPLNATRYTVIDNPLANGNPRALLFIEHNLNPTYPPGQLVSTINPYDSPYIVSPVAVNYLPDVLKWAIVVTQGQGLGHIPIGAAFNVMVISEP